MGYEGSNPSLSTSFKVLLQQAVVAQMVERVLGKDEVTGSIPVNGSILYIPYPAYRGRLSTSPFFP